MSSFIDLIGSMSGAYTPASGTASSSADSTGLFSEMLGVAAMSMAQPSVVDTGSGFESGGNDMMMAILLFLFMNMGGSSMPLSGLSGGYRYDYSNYQSQSAGASSEEAFQTNTQLLSGMGSEAQQLLSSYMSNPALASQMPIVQAAMSRLGDPYSQKKAGQGDYTDCSYLSRWCYRQMGIELPRTAAAQAKHLVEKGQTIDKSELQPGDLIFFSLHKNDRYMDITHVGIYAGNGMMVDASSNEGEVVYRKLFGGQVLYGRPR